MVSLRSMANERILAVFKGRLIHTTSPSNFRSIVRDGRLLRGQNKNSCGKCQALNCLSLNDLSRLGPENFQEGAQNWKQQFLEPWGGLRRDPVTVTLVFTRELLQTSKLRYLQDQSLEALLGPPNGRYIAESEVCYEGDISVNAIEEVLFLATATDPLEYELLQLEVAIQQLEEFQRRYPPEATALIQDDMFEFPPHRGDGDKP